MATNKRCAICANAYGTQYICSKCRQGIITYTDKDGTIKTWVDPSLGKNWVESSGRKAGAREASGHEYKDTDVPAVFTGIAHRFTYAERGVADGILHGETDVEIARKVGLSVQHVNRIRRWFLKESK